MALVAIGIAGGVGVDCGVGGDGDVGGVVGMVDVRKERGMSERVAKYRPNQVVRILHDWAKDIPSRPIEDVAWDECWNCYTYSFPLAMIRIEEFELEATGDPDITPADWVKASRQLNTEASHD